MPPAAAPTQRRSRAGLVGAVVTIILVGFVARGVLLSFAPRYGFLGDHVDYVCWGRQALAAGVLDLYRNKPEPCLTDTLFDGVPQRLQTGSQQRLNYPALAAYVFAIEGRLLARLEPAAIANTLTARTVYALSTTIAELVTALGVATLVASFAGAWAAVAAFGATWLAPPLLLDGAFWGQTESWVLAPGVWMVLAMIRQRWLRAGVLWGVALALKPSGLIFAPLWLYALLFRRERVPIVLAGVVALAVVNVVALPFWLDSGQEWLRVTYLENYVYDIPWSTAMTFNVWYADLLATGVLDPHVPLFGLARDVWSTLLLATGIAGAYALTRRWERREPARAELGMIPLAALVMLAAILLPTRVHSTYGAFTAPFVIATAFLIPRTTFGAVLCTITMSLQILSWQWAHLLAMHVQPDESIFPPAQRARRVEWRAIDRPREWALIIANLAAAAAIAAGVAMAPRAPSDVERPSDRA